METTPAVAARRRLAEEDEERRERDEGVAGGSASESEVDLGLHIVGCDRAQLRQRITTASEQSISREKRETRSLLAQPLGCRGLIFSLRLLATAN